MWSKVIFGHPKWPFCEKIYQKNKSCVLIWNDEKCNLKWFSVIQNGRRQPFCEKNHKNQSCLLIWNGEKCDRKWFSVIQIGRRQPFYEFKKKIKVAYWSQMARNVIESDFRSSKMAASSHFAHKNIKVAYWSEMVRNAIKNDFRSSKMAAGSHFVKKEKLRIDLKWRDIRSKVIFGHPKWPLATILWNKKVVYWYEMTRNAIKSDFRSSKMAAGSHFVKNIKVVYWSEMVRNAIESDFRSSKMATGSHFVNKIKKIKVEYLSKMARNAIKIHFRSSKIGGW